MEFSRMQSAKAKLLERAVLFGLWVAASLSSTGVHAQTTTFLEQGQLIRSSQNFVPLGPELMGDRVNLFTGSLEFVQTDVSLPGNDNLSVSVGRRYVAAAGRQSTYDALFGDWDLDIPHLHGIFNGYGPAVPQGWTVVGSSPPNYTSLNRCSAFSAPAGIHTAKNFWSADEFWGGNFLYVPGSGDQKMLRRDPANTSAPSDGAAYPVVTRPGWQFSCISGLRSPLTKEGTQPAGEGFLAVSPQGVRIRFDWIATRGYQGTIGEQGLIQRQEVWILPTLVTDRFGNTVTYSYDTTDPWKLLSIVASDGRALRLSYGSSHFVSSVSDGSRTWNYTYGSGAAGGVNLSQVSLPDASRWTFALQEQNWVPYFNPMPGCGTPGSLDPRTKVSTMTHPSGATASYTLSFIARGRLSQSPSSAPCTSNVGSLTYATRSLTSKTLTGPGVAAATWAYAWSPAVDELACGTSCDRVQTLTVTDPQGNQDRYLHGIVMGMTEGQLLQHDEGWDGQKALRSTVLSYRPGGAGAYPEKAGDSGSWTGDDYMETAYLPLSTRTIYQQDVSFIRRNTGFDTLARVTGADLSSSLGFAKSEALTYADNTALWVMGQVASRSVNGIAAQTTAYASSTALPNATYAFGKLSASYGFNADGTLRTLADGAGHTTTFSAYKRGLAQTIDHADGSRQQATVNDIGLVTSLTNEAGTTTSYGYDAIGRLASIVHPGGDPVTYNATTIAFQQAGDEYGLGADHWRQTITTGNGVTVNHFDALLRKRITSTYDAANVGTTQGMVLAHYDAANRKVFESYPARTIASITATPAGTAASYDALDRPTQTVADSELGTLTTAFQYLSGFQTRVTTPRNYATTTSYQAFDVPSEEAVAGIVAPEGLNVTIARDAFGKPLAITRSGSYGGSSVGATRSYVYDANQLLCKSVEPETGATIQWLDAANNVSWRATGLNLPGTTSCDTASVPGANKTLFTYDARNRLTGTGFGDGSASIGRSYTADGLPASVVSGNSTWTYAYNNRRLRTAATLVYGQTFNLAWAFDANGHVSQLTYPDRTSVTYVPDALGQATQVSGYASGISYQPNGAIAGYTLASGINHSQSQNTRGLPLKNADAGVLQDQYSYDADGNITAIADQQEGISGRTMAYDGLNRLTASNAPGVWGNASYGYDPLDNLRTSVVGSRSSAHLYDASNRLSMINTNGVNTAYTYDAQGNITARGTRGYYFDLGNRLQLSNGVESYQYDGLGRRTGIYKNTGVNQTQVYSPDGALLFGTYQAASTASSTRYIYLAGKQIAETDSATGTTTYAHTDALGSPVAKTNAAGAVLSRTRYEAYGNTAAGTVPTTIGFTGHVNDADTGLVYMQQRYYDPVAGRFQSVDPVTTDAGTGAGFNLYEYANNNPYRYTDPDGRVSIGENLAASAQEAADRGEKLKTFGFKLIGFAWSVFGAEGVSRVIDRGVGASTEDKVSAGLELLAVIPGGKLLGEAAVAAKGVLPAAAAKIDPVKIREIESIVRSGGTHFPLDTGAQLRAVAESFAGKVRGAASPETAAHIRDVGLGAIDRLDRFKALTPEAVQQLRDIVNGAFKP